jgi:tRNA 5-methylaminomethyl-2-thiouridine biosynthesis bifunctional protein
MGWPVTLQTARLLYRDDGTPYAPAFDDIYHSAAGGAGQARHVFVAGSGLPGRWAGRELFTIVETGFGLGVNFIATWQAWRSDAARCRRLHFVSLDLHPPCTADLRRALAPLFQADEGASLVEQLCGAWPICVPGLHRLEFDDGNLVLTLGFGAARELLPQLWLRAKAFYLDGFAPEKNPAMWEPFIFKGLARLADDAEGGATVATYTAAGLVKQGLRNAGFEVRRRPGYAGKIHMLTGRFAPRWRVRRHEPPASVSGAGPGPGPDPSRSWRGPAHPTCDALVIGGGLAGCAVVQRLAQRGYRVGLLERAADCASAASGNPAAVFHPLVTRDDSPAARLARAGFLYTLRHWAELDFAAHGAQAEGHAGLLQIAARSDALSAQEMAATLAKLDYPASLAVAVSRTEASALAGVSLAAGGWWFPQGGWLVPRALCNAQLAAAGTRLMRRFDTTVFSLARRDGLWHALDATGASLACAPVAVLANATEAARLAGLRYAPTRSVRGQISLLPAAAACGLRIPIVGDGYLVPLHLHAPGEADRDRPKLLAGASYDLDDTDLGLRLSSHRENLERSGHLLELGHAALDATTLGGRVSLRCVTSDRLPMIGQLADEAAAQRAAASLAGAHPLDLPRSEGLYGAFAYGSRGLTWAALGAELLASMICGEPLPIERDLADAVDPARFLLKALRRREI